MGKGPKEIRSPCVSVCVYNLEENYCTGCFRDLHDIDGWFAMNNTEKREALRRCKKNRRKALLDGR